MNSSILFELLLLLWLHHPLTIWFFSKLIVFFSVLPCRYFPFEKTRREMSKHSIEPFAQNFLCCLLFSFHLNKFSSFVKKKSEILLQSEQFSPVFRRIETDLFERDFLSTNFFQSPRIVGGFSFHFRGKIKSFFLFILSLISRFWRSLFDWLTKNLSFTEKCSSLRRKTSSDEWLSLSLVRLKSWKFCFDDRLIRRKNFVTSLFNWRFVFQSSTRYLNMDMAAQTLMDCSCTEFHSD